VTTRAASVMRAAEMYYLEQMTMDAIAETIGCSRATVSRMISEARTSGLVEITVHRHRRAAATLERLIAERYNVDVTVVAPPENANDTDRLRHAAAQAGSGGLRAVRTARRRHRGDPGRRGQRRHRGYREGHARVTPNALP